MFDAVGIPEAIARGETTARRAYEDYSDGAARPYARSTFDLLLHRADDTMAGPPSEPTTTDDVKADATSADYWGERLKVKPSVARHSPITPVSGSTAARSLYSMARAA